MQTEKQLQQILAANDQCVDAWNLLSAIQAKNGKIDHCIASLSKVILLDPTSSLARSNLAYCYILKKQYALGIKWAREALKIKTDDVVAWANLSIAQFHLEMVDEASVSTQKGLMLDPNHGELLYQAGHIMAKKDKYRFVVGPEQDAFQLISRR